MLFIKTFIKAIYNELRIFPSTSFRRLLIVFILFLFFILLETINYFFLFLDEIIFYKYKYVKIKEPVFLLGVPRSGTTFLYKLFYLDEKKYTAMKVWEIVFAPSISQKKLFILFSKLDLLLKNPFKKLITKIDKLQYKKLGVMHQITTFSIEEDEPILLHIFASAYLHILFPDQNNLLDYSKFDTNLTVNQKNKIMHFYKKCIKKHLYVFGTDKQYLAKNPSFNMKVKSLNEYFPDCKFVYLVRNPLQAVPSIYSLFSFFYNFFYKSNHAYIFNDSYLTLIYDWYTYPLIQLEKLNKERYIVLNYDDFIRDSYGSIKDVIYTRFNYEFSDDYSLILKSETDRAKKYKSKHNYKISQFNINEDIIKNKFAEIIHKFNF